MKLSERLRKFLIKYYYPDLSHKYLSNILEIWKKSFILRITEVIGNGLLVFGSVACFVSVYRCFNGMFAYYDIPVFIISTGLLSWLISNWYKFFKQEWRKK